MSVGDFHLKNLVAFALAGEPRGDDARMLELLAPYAGRRALVVRVLELGWPAAAALRTATRAAGHPGDLSPAIGRSAGSAVAVERVALDRRSDRAGR